jgi:hypothetical protein
MASAYPGGLDNFATNKANATATPTDHPGHHNDLADAVNKIEAELGIDPAGASATVVARLNAIGVWTTWSPTIAQATLGDGTVVARYTQIGDQVLGQLTFTLGGTSAVSTNPTFTTPVAASAQYTAFRNWVGGGICFESGASEYPLRARLNDANTLGVRIFNAASTIVVDAGITATVPFTWGTGDILTFSFAYEAA